MSETLQKPGKRLVSIDVMRGMTVAFMIMVNNNGNNDLAYRSMNHSSWNGFTPTDFVFPNFLFIMGISIVLSWRSQKAKGVPDKTLVGHIFRRFALLFLLGLVVNGFPYFHLGTLRIYGVLQRIAVCYLFAGLLQLFTTRLAPRIALIVAALAGYWILLRWVPIPGHGMPVRDFPLLDHDLNLVAYLDRHIFPHRLFEGTRDPEGLLSDLPAIASTLLGMVAGDWLVRLQDKRRAAVGFVMVGLVLIFAGLLWSPVFPINKKLWTSSYVLYAGGWSFLFLAACYYVVEMRAWTARWTYPWLIFGTNAITAYVFSELLSSTVADFHVTAAQSIQQFVYDGFFKSVVNPAFGSFLYSAAFLVVCFMPVWWMYRSRVFLKL